MPKIISSGFKFGVLNFGAIIKIAAPVSLVFLQVPLVNKGSASAAQHAISKNQRAAPLTRGSMRRVNAHISQALRVFMDDRAFTKLIDYLEKVPAINPGIAKGSDSNGCWWVKFSININHQFAWHTVQELGHVLNYLSVNERLPTSFHPVSAPPYMNGGPSEYLSWVIECSDPDMRPGTCAEWLIGRLPQPVEDLSKWGAE